MLKLRVDRKTIAERLGRTYKAVCAHIVAMDEKNRVYTLRTRMPQATDVAPPSDILRARDAYVMAPKRNLSGALLGDPPIGYSALDHKIAMGKAINL